MDINSIAVKGRKYINHDIWQIRIEKEPKIKKALIQTLKIFLLAFKGFQDDRVKLRASALTFFSLLSIVPVLAMAFGIAKGFGLDKELERQIIINFTGQEEFLSQVLVFARTLLENTKGGIVAGVGFILLMYSVMELLNNIERSFNDIWYINKERPLVRKFTDYLTIILVAPVLMIISNSLTVYITNTIQNLTETVTLIALFKSVIFPLLRLLPFIVIWLMFTLLYIIMPNIKVKVSSAIIAGVIAGTAFLIVEWALIRFQINVSTYNAIYGSFAALPLFLIWLQFSWLIVLFGAEVSYAHQNIKKYEFERHQMKYSENNKKLASIMVMHYLVTRFVKGKRAPFFSDINKAVKIPTRFLHQIMETLVECGLVSEINTKQEETAYQPAMDTDLLSPAFILDILDNCGESDPDFTGREISRKFTGILDDFRTEIKKSHANKLLKNIESIPFEEADH